MMTTTDAAFLITSCAQLLATIAQLLMVLWRRR